MKKKIIATCLVTPFFISSCMIKSQEENRRLNIYQPSILRLEKEVPINTLDGVYTPQIDEVWHSDARFRRLERELYYDNK